MLSRYYLSERQLKLTVSTLVMLGVALWALLSSATFGLKDAAVARVASKLERRFARPPLSDGRPVAGLVVLGGSPARALEALTLARRYPRAQVILSGPGPAEEEVLRRAPELKGRLVIDRRARNTFENALYSLGIDGTGQKLAVMGQGDVYLDDINFFRAGFGLSALCRPISRSSGASVRPQ